MSNTGKSIKINDCFLPTKSISVTSRWTTNDNRWSVVKFHIRESFNYEQESLICFYLCQCQCKKQSVIPGRFLNCSRSSCGCGVQHLFGNGNLHLAKTYTEIYYLIRNSDKALLLNEISESLLNKLNTDLIFDFVVELEKYNIIFHKTFISKDDTKVYYTDDYRKIENLRRSIEVDLSVFDLAIAFYKQSPENKYNYRTSYDKTEECKGALMVRGRSLQYQTIYDIISEFDIDKSIREAILKSSIYSRFVVGYVEEKAIIFASYHVKAYSVYEQLNQEKDLFYIPQSNKISYEELVKDEKYELISLEWVDNKLICVQKFKNQDIFVIKKTKKIYKINSDIFDTFSIREQDILKIRYGLPSKLYSIDSFFRRPNLIEIAKPEESFYEIGKIFNITTERVRQIEAKVLKRLERHNEQFQIAESISDIDFKTDSTDTVTVSTSNQ